MRGTFTKNTSILRSEMLLLLGSSVAAVLATAVFASKVTSGLNLFEFADETEKFIGAQMLQNGGHLYRDVFAHHGPVPYMIAHLYTALVSETDFSFIRILQALLAAASCASLAFSPVFKATAPRALAVATYLLLLSSVWTVLWVHMLLYQAIGGFFLVILLSQLTLPCLFNEQPTKGGLIASGAAGALACFCAYSFGPAVVLFILPSLICIKSTAQIIRYSKPFIFGALSSVTAITLWLFKFGDIEGFFIYHFYFMLKVYSKFIDYSPGLALRNLSISLEPNHLIHSFSLFLLATSLYTFIVSKAGNTSGNSRTQRILGIASLVAGVVMTNPRHENFFHDSAFVITSFTLFSIVSAVAMQTYLGNRLRWRLIRPLILIGTAILLAMNVARDATPTGVLKGDMSEYVVEMKPKKGGIYDFVRSIATRDRDLLVLIFHPAIYIRTGRLPASGHYYYLPWQAAYNKVALRGYRIDICADIVSQNPAVIFFDNWRVWGKYPIEEYEPCVLSLIAERYARIRGKIFWYIRKDLLTTNVGSPPQDSYEENWISYLMRSSVVLTSFSPIQLTLSPEHLKKRVGLKRVGVLMTGNSRRNPGTAELMLKGTDGSIFRQQFMLADLIDRQYQYFNVDSKQYSAGEIFSVTGEGISALESFAEHGDTYTCMTYEYVDGSSAFTPGCPL